MGKQTRNTSVVYFWLFVEKNICNPTPAVKNYANFHVLILAIYTIHRTYLQRLKEVKSFNRAYRASKKKKKKILSVNHEEK